MQWNNIYPQQVLKSMYWLLFSYKTEYFSDVIFNNKQICLIQLWDSNKIHKKGNYN
jgi:hypothetical protein